MEPQQRERYTDVVVEVALRGVCRIACSLSQNGRDHLCDRGLAVASRHGDHRQRELGTPQTRQLTQRASRVGHFRTGQACAGEPLMCQRCHRTGGLGLRQKIVRIETLALERHEQVAGAQTARVRVHTSDGHVDIAHGACAGELRQELSHRFHA